MAKTNTIGYTNVMKRLPEGFRTFPETKIHTCLELNRANRKRARNGEGRVYIFADYENEKFNMKIGLEFVQVNHCPFCGAKL